MAAGTALDDRMVKRARAALEAAQPRRRCTVARTRSWTTSVALAALLLGSAVSAGSTEAATPASLAAAAYARMSTSQRIGQLFVAAVPVTGSTLSARAALARYHVGNVVLVGASFAGTAGVAAQVAPVRRVATQAAVLPFVGVDQEGGYVQHLKGVGFSTIPTALRQGQLSTATLRGDWRLWAGQLRRPGVNLDLAPVADVVPASVGTRNQPIGRYYREYGYTPAAVGSHVSAVVLGMRDAGITATAKHFPGIGRATGNTDTTVGVTDPTTRYDAYLAPFRSAIAAGAPVVMVSTAIYPRIDRTTVGAFSHLIVTTMLRHQLGFNGLIVSDSLTAVSLQNYTYATRAIRALDAGVDVLLVTSNTPVAAMTSAIAGRMRTSPAFASVVRTAVLRVLTAKASAGLVHP
ncbi:MAG TPA: glycoside hydrolase family 3 N-terminal domain-containing protein [Actinomycetales bacterium]|nr:glycoside hydrolase family 3 N-terminal domain-containing protein [Actinomycetales bacterium]